MRVKLLTVLAAHASVFQIMSKLPCFCQNH